MRHWYFYLHSTRNYENLADMEIKKDLSKSLRFFLSKLLRFFLSNSLPNQGKFLALCLSENSSLYLRSKELRRVPLLTVSIYLSECLSDFRSRLKTLTDIEIQPTLRFKASRTMRPILPPMGTLAVFWDINRCPVPVDYDARRVGPCIVRYLMKLGHSGRFSITAVGLLSKVPKEILEAVSSSGIRLYDLAYGRKSMETHILIFLQRSLPPTHVMLISPPRYFDLFLSSVDESQGEHVIFPFPTDSSDADAKFLWDKLLLEENVKCSKALEPWVCPTCHVFHHDNELEEISPEDVKCSKTFEPGNSLCWVCREEEEEEEQDYDPEIFPERATWVCGVCVNLPGRGFENFLAHLASEVHTELDQVDDLDDKHPSQVEFHWLFRNKTVSQLTYREAAIAEEALRILQTEFFRL